MVAVGVTQRTENRISCVISEKERRNQVAIFTMLCNMSFYDDKSNIHTITNIELFSKFFVSMHTSGLV